VWAGVGDGTFRPDVVFGSPYDYVAPGVGDLDGDGRADALIGSTDIAAGAEVVVAFLNATYGAGSPFEDLGGACGLPGTGYPIQLARGRLLPNSTFRFDGVQLPPQSEAWFVMGLSTGPGALSGWPAPVFDALLGPLPTGATGALSVRGVRRDDLPAGLEFFTQFWVRDASGRVGCSSTVRGVMP